MAVLEPYAIPGFDRLLVKLFLIVVTIIGSLVFLTISSIVGIIRAFRRRRRGGNSDMAIVLAGIAVALITCWLAYWVGDDIFHHQSPFNGMLAINLSFCMLPLSWLIVAIRANAAGRKSKEPGE